MSKILKNKFRATLLGLAIGDALGNPLEGMTPNRIADKYGEVIDYQELWNPKGTVTDDTELTLCTAESLISSRGFNLEDLAKRFIRWLPNANSFGITCQTAIVNLKEGKSPCESGIDSPGNGSAMRIAPIGLLYSRPKDFDKLVDITKESTYVTHANQKAFAGALAISASIAYLLNYKLDPKKMLDYLIGLTSGIDDQFRDRLNIVKSSLDKRVQDVAKELGTSSYVLESVPFALYCFLRNPFNVEDNLVTAINAGGDTDTNASIAGALSGCYHGTKAIPKRWVTGLKDVTKIEKTADRLFKLYQKLE